MDLEQRSINVGKALVMDTVWNANSGHTGGPLSSLDFTYILFKELCVMTLRRWGLRSKVDRE